MEKYTFVHQTEERDCGLASQNMLLLYYGEVFSLDYLKKLYNYENSEMDFYSLSLIAQKLGYAGNAYYIDDLNNIHHSVLPCIAQIEISDGVWHFVTVFAKSNEHIIIGNPAKKICTISLSSFNRYFTGYVLKIENKITV